MAQSVLVKIMLTAEMIAAGRRLLIYLDSQQFVFDTAFWMLDDDVGEWRMCMSSARVHTEGPKLFYNRVNQAIFDLALTQILSIEMISIADERGQLVRHLIDALGQASSVDGVRLDNATIAGAFLSGCLLYRVTAEQTLAVEMAAK